MHANAWGRDLLLLGVAVGVGWWMRGADRPVLAQRSSSSSSARGADAATLAFQISGSGRETALTMYNPENHTLYVYPEIGLGNSLVSCSFSYRVDRPGAPIERGTCPVGDLVR